MINLRKILVPIDFSSSSKLAYAYASTFAMEYGCEIHLVSVVEEIKDAGSMGDPLNISTKWQREVIIDTEDRLTDFIGKYGKELCPKCAVLTGDPALSIIDYAKTQDVDLILLGAHGIKGFQEDWLGLTSYNVVRKSPCPVLTVKPSEKDFIVDYQ